MGYAHYVRMLQLVSSEPRLASVVAQALGRRIERVRDALWRMERAGLVHVAAWVPQSHHRGLLLPKFSGRPGTSKPYPRATRPDKAGGRKRAIARTTLASFIALAQCLRSGDHTRRDLSDATGLIHHVVGRTLRQMRLAGLAHRSGWRRRVEGYHEWAELFTWGPGDDVPHPPVVSAVESGRRYRQRIRMIKQQAANASALGADVAHAGGEQQLNNIDRAAA